MVRSAVTRPDASRFTAGMQPRAAHGRRRATMIGLQARLLDVVDWQVKCFLDAGALSGFTSRLFQVCCLLWFHFLACDMRDS